MSYNLVTGVRACRAELYISRWEKEENKTVFDYLYARKEAIEEAFGDALTWSRMGDRIASRIRVDLELGILDEEEWPRIIDFFADRVGRLHAALTPHALAIEHHLKQN